MARMKTVIVIGTLDTKGPELAYLQDQVIASGCQALLMDVGVHNQSETAADINAGEVARTIGEDIEVLRALPRARRWKESVTQLRFTFCNSWRKIKHTE